MTRAIGPDDSVRAVYRTETGLVKARGLPVRYYLDEPLTQLADVLSLTGQPLAESSTQVDEWSRWPLVQYPDDVQVLYGSVAGGPAVMLPARIAPQLAALGVSVGTATGRVASVEGLVGSGSVGAGVSRFIRRSKAAETAMKITVLGDSVMQGAGATAGVNDAATLIAQDLGTRFGVAYTLINRAVSGYTLATAATFGSITAALDDAADLYVISFAKNDTVADLYPSVPTRGYPLAQSMRALELLIREIRRRVPQAEVLILGTCPNAAADTVSNVAISASLAEQRKIARVYGAEFADAYAAFLAVPSYTTALLSDGVHPNVAGHRLMADTVLARIPATYAGPSQAIASQPAADSSVWGAHLVDPTIQLQGWVVRASAGVGATGRWSTVGTWTGAGPYVTTTAGDYAEVVFHGTEAAMSLDASAASALVADVVVDGVTVYTDVNFAQLPTTTQPLFVLGKNLSPHFRHTVRLVLKSGTLRVYKAMWQVGARRPPVSASARKLIPARYHHSGAQTVTTNSIPVGQAFVVPFYIPTDTTLDTIAVDVTTAAPTGTVTIGLYSADEYDQPADLIVSSGPLSAAATGFKKLTGTVGLIPGWYWVAVLALGATVAVRVNGSSHPLVSSSAESSAAGLSAYLATGLADLPTAWTATAAAAVGPRVFVKPV